MKSRNIVDKLCHAEMTKDEDIPDWVGAHEFYDKYDPKEILGRYTLGNKAQHTRDTCSMDNIFSSNAS